MRPGPGASHGLLTSLPDLAADYLTLVPHAPALIGVGLAELADFRGHLADSLLVDAFHDKPGGGLDPDGDALRRAHGQGVAGPERERHVAAPGLDAVADADDLQGLAIAVRDAGDHVGDQRPGQAVQRAHGALIVRPGDLDDVVLADDV